MLKVKDQHVQELCNGFSCMHITTSVTRPIIIAKYVPKANGQHFLLCHVGHK